MVAPLFLLWFTLNLCFSSMTDLIKIFQLEEVKKKQRTLEAENATLKQSNSELTEKVSAFKEKVSLKYCLGSMTALYIVSLAGS